MLYSRTADALRAKASGIVSFFVWGMLVLNVGEIFSNEIGGLWGSFMYLFFSQILSAISVP